jgi:pimeloyl-ACP methyl ester carboxylesterase
MHVAVAGPEDGEPVMLLHGWPQHWWLWRNIIPPLAQNYKVYAADLKGFGWSDAPAGVSYNKHELAKDILALIDSLGIDQPLKLAGHDWGGWTSFLMAMKEPERFDRFMALNIPPPWGDPGPFDIGQNLKALSKLAYQVPLSTPGVSRWVQAGGGRGRFRNGLVKAAHNKAAWDNGAVDVYIDQFKQPARSDATMHLYRSMILHEVPKIALGKYVRGRLTVPTKILFGADDVAVSLDTILADHSSMADDLKVEVIQDCGHFIVDEQPQLVADRLLDWFGRSA